MGAHLVKHGDGVKDISFSVEDLDAIMERAKQRGCKVVDDIWEESDENGKVHYLIFHSFKSYLFFDIRSFSFIHLLFLISFIHSFIPSFPFFVG